MVTPKWLSCYISDSEIDGLSKKVAELEKSTSVEIVSMVVERSSVTRHVFWLLFLSILVIFAEIQRGFLWGFEISIEVFIFLALVLTALGLSFLMNKLIPHFLTRLFTPNLDLEAQVFNRAHLEFHKHQLAETEGKTGILIFVSILERCVVVLADKGISDKLPPDTWNNVVTNLTQDLRKKELAQGLTKAVEHVSKLVTPLFPAKDVNPNELTDYLIISD